MLKLRIQGLPEEVAQFGDALEEAGLVLERSGQYANRGRSQFVREYIEIEAPRDGPMLEAPKDEQRKDKQ